LIEVFIRLLPSHIIHLLGPHPGCIRVVVYCIQVLESTETSAPATQNARKWSGKRRPVYSRRQSPTGARDEASAKIALASDAKREYYLTKLQMRCTEHEQRMKVMRLEEEVLLKRLGRGLEE